MLDNLLNIGYHNTRVETEVSDMWTTEEINEYSVYLDRQEQAVLTAINLGFKTIDQIETFVLESLGDYDPDYVETVYNIHTNPERKVPLEVL